MFFIRLSKDGRKGGTQTKKHILRATGGEEDPGVSHRESHLLAWGVARTQPSATCWQQPRRYHLAGMVKGAPQAQSRSGPGSRTDEKGTDGSVEGTIIRRDFGTGVEDFFFFFFFQFPSSLMWKQHSARRKTGVDRTQRQTEGQVSYPPPDLKER